MQVAPAGSGNRRPSWPNAVDGDDSSISSESANKAALLKAQREKDKAREAAIREQQVCDDSNLIRRQKECVVSYILIH